MRGFFWIFFGPLVRRGGAVAKWQTLKLENVGFFATCALDGEVEGKCDSVLMTTMKH